MNSYRFGFLIEPTTPPVIGDATALGRLCSQIGSLLFAHTAPQYKKFRPALLRPGGQMTITTGAFVATNATTGNPQTWLDIESPFRLNTSLMPPAFGATSSGEVVTAGAAIMAATTFYDDMQTTMLTSIDRTVVTRGCGIVAYVPAGVSLSAQLEAEAVFNVCNGQQLVIGIANQTAQDGVYTPFPTAWGYAIMGGSPIENVAVVTAAGGRPTSYGGRY